VSEIEPFDRGSLNAGTQCLNCTWNEETSPWYQSSPSTVCCERGSSTDVTCYHMEEVKDHCLGFGLELVTTLVSDL